ncbi:MAG TPA: isochorismatase family protein [Sinorhizobium sp.]|nr:isochorismatase family protein [Sinorhizobium sp.]
MRREHRHDHTRRDASQQPRLPAWPANRFGSPRAARPQGDGIRPSFAGCLYSQQPGVFETMQPSPIQQQENHMSFERFTGENAAMLLIDHQVGTMGWVRSIPFEDMKRNALMLAKVAKILRMPVVLTSSMEEDAQGPLVSELEEILPTEFGARIKRIGIVNAMDDEHFATAVRTIGRKKLILAGVTNDVCTVFPALSLVHEGYEVQTVADAGGSPSKMGDEMALRRMEQNGVTLTSTNQIIAELAGNWTTSEGSQIVQEVVMEALQA